MEGKTNAGFIMGVINVSCPAGSTVTVTKGTMSFSRSNVSSASFNLPSAGTWTVTGKKGSLSQTKSVTLVPGQTASVSLSYRMYLFNSSASDYYCTANSGGWVGHHEPWANTSISNKCLHATGTEGNQYLCALWEDKAAVNFTDFSTITVTVSEYTVGAFKRLELYLSNTKEWDAPNDKKWSAAPPGSYTNVWDISAKGTYTKSVSGVSGSRYVKLYKNGVIFSVSQIYLDT